MNILDFTDQELRLLLFSLIDRRAIVIESMGKLTKYTDYSMEYPCPYLSECEGLKGLTKLLYDIDKLKYKIEDALEDDKLDC